MSKSNKRADEYTPLATEQKKRTIVGSVQAEDNDDDVDGETRSSSATAQRRSGPASSKIAKIVAAMLTLAGIIGFVALIVIQAHENNNEGKGSKPVVQLLPCSFDVPFTNWVNYGNSIGKNCTANEVQMNCTSDVECESVDQDCVPGATSLLKCIKSKHTKGTSACGFVSRSLPSINYGAGYCNNASRYSTCALCLTGVCRGIAICAESDHCSNKDTEKYGYTMECFREGHSHTGGGERIGGQGFWEGIKKKMFSES